MKGLSPERPVVDTCKGDDSACRPHNHGLRWASWRIWPICPRACDWGCKKNSQSKQECWRGYKLHLDVIDGDIPVSAILTSASLHDSQAAIPLAQMSAGRIVNLHDLSVDLFPAQANREIRKAGRGALSQKFPDFPLSRLKRAERSDREASEAGTQGSVRLQS